jgi:hypothetical protein
VATQLLHNSTRASTLDDNGLALVYEETTASGQKSNFNKLLKRQTAKAKLARA